jgi:Flp pilus assembly protein TadG
VFKQFFMAPRNGSSFKPLAEGHRAVCLASRLRGERGANLVEAAFLLPVLLLVLCGIMEFAGILYTRLALQNGVSQAARYAITRRVLPDKTREESIIEILRKRTPGISIPDSEISFSHQQPGAGSWDDGTGPGGSIERVTVRHHWNIMTPIMSYFFPYGGFEIRADGVMKNESEGA